jgi:hypothetical protein
MLQFRHAQTAVLHLKIGASTAITAVTTQAPIDPKYSTSHQKGPRVQVYWTAVTYKTVILYVVLVVAIISAGIYAAKPDFYSKLLKKIDGAVSSADAEALAADQRHAKFVNLDGKVEVKKVNSVQWVEADFHTTLDKGDQIKTGPDSDARITFGDGTTYTMKPDALVTVEENNSGINKPSSSAIGITVGTVDWATPTLSLTDSTAEIRVEDTRAHLGSNSRGAVKADPENKSSEVVVSSGSAQVQRGPEKIDLAQYERATIPNTGAIQKSNMLAPPDLVAPLNLTPIIAENPKTSTVHFEWKPVPDAVSYRLRISTTAMFTKMVKEEPTKGTAVDITGLEPGDYFWDVSATDSKKQISEFSDFFKFTLVTQGKSQDMFLEVGGTQLHGRVVEIFGRTEPGAALIINGQSVPNISPDGTFRHFTEPLEPGQHTIVVIGQNRRGGTNMKQVSIVVPK